MRAEDGLAGTTPAAAVPRSKYSTSTARQDGTIVPWLAASGPLAYTPESPPPSDYWFQNGWVLPGIFAPNTNRRRHRYFGEQRKEYASELFRFWGLARAGRVRRRPPGRDDRRPDRGLPHEGRARPGAVRLHPAWKASEEGLNLAEGPGSVLWRAACESFTLVRWVAENKFGPNFVIGTTPLDNVRITTFFAGEHEVRLLDPERFEICETHACRVRRPSA